MTTFEQAYAGGAVGLISWLKDSPNGGHNRLTPEEVVLVAKLMNNNQNDAEVLTVWGALQRDMIHLDMIHPLIVNRLLQSCGVPPISAEDIETNRLRREASMGVISST